jgi:hypothetical protein
VCCRAAVVRQGSADGEEMEADPSGGDLREGQEGPFRRAFLLSGMPVRGGCGLGSGASWSCSILLSSCSAASGWMSAGSRMVDPSLDLAARPRRWFIQMKRVDSCLGGRLIAPSCGLWGVSLLEPGAPSVLEEGAAAEGMVRMGATAQRESSGNARERS